MNKEKFAELLTAQKLAVKKFCDRRSQVGYFYILTKRTEKIFNVLDNYVKSRRIRNLREM